MTREEFDIELKRLTTLISPTKDPQEAIRRRAITDELWRIYGIGSGEKWRAMVSRVIQTHSRFGAPIPSDFSKAETFLSERDLKPSVASVRQTTPEEARDYGVRVASKLTRAGAEIALNLAAKFKVNLDEEVSRGLAMALGREPQITRGNMSRMAEILPEKALPVTRIDSDASNHTGSEQSQPTANPKISTNPDAVGYFR